MTILTADGTMIGTTAFDASQPPALSGAKAQGLMTAARETDCSKRIDAYRASMKGK